MHRKVNCIHVLVFCIGIIWIVILASLWQEIHLQESCVESWDTWICKVGNISGLCSSCFWSICMIPQIWKNYTRGTTKGLSFRWACANVVAAFINLNFVLRISVPLYVTISALYMPILEIIIVVQFGFMADNRYIRYISWGVVLTLGVISVLFVTFWHDISTATSGLLMWGAVVLWSIETFPQLWLNARNRSTDGQSPETVLISFLGKTTDFVSMISLGLPLQFQIMTYFSTASAYLNIVQYLYYRKLYKPASCISLLVFLYSFFMVVKVGWKIAFILFVFFVVFLLFGYYIDNVIFLVNNPVSYNSILVSDPIGQKEDTDESSTRSLLGSQEEIDD
jgi:hypothetical protein